MGLCLKCIQGNLSSPVAPADYLLKTMKQYKNLQNGIPKSIYKNQLDRAYLQPDMGHGGVIDLPSRAASDKVLHDKAF